MEKGTKIKAIITDDEKSARDVMQNLIIRFCPEIEVISTCKNIPETVEQIKKLKPDVIILDIEMPNYAGYEIVSFFETIDFDIVFVTAYNEYAIKAFEISAVDYLLKPVEIERLKETVKRLLHKKSLKNTHQEYKILSENLKNDANSKIILKSNRGQQIIQFNQIIAIEANEAYSCIHTFEGIHTASKNLKYFENILENNNSFFRTHKSWIVNLSAVLSFSKLEIKLKNNITAKLSKYKIKDFKNAI